jgi:hypothetical protein
MHGCVLSPRGYLKRAGGRLHTMQLERSNGRSMRLGGVLALGRAVGFRGLTVHC